MQPNLNITKTELLSNRVQGKYQCQKQTTHLRDYQQLKAKADFVSEQETVFAY